MRISNPGIDDISHHIDVATNRIAVALVILGGLLGSAIIGAFTEGDPQVMGVHLLSFVGFVLSGIFGVWLLWGIFRHGRL
jgi:ubiquinone biosynthesis protein